LPPYDKNPTSLNEKRGLLVHSIASPRSGFASSEKHRLPNTRKEIEVQDFSEIYGNELRISEWSEVLDYKKAPTPKEVGACGRLPDSY
jgi:hypothetical protein